MSQVVDLVGNTLHVDGVVTGDGPISGADATTILVGAVVESAGGNIEIAADDTIAEALQAIADVADPDVG